MAQETSSAAPVQEHLEIRTRILAHFRARPFSSHFAAWMLVGISFGLLIAPNLLFASIAGFCISGCIVCFVLAMLTYPVSDHYRLVIVGAIAGSAMIPVSNWLAPVQLSVVGPPLCLMIGALIGATALVWLSPLRAWALWTGRQRESANSGTTR